MTFLKYFILDHFLDIQENKINDIKTRERGNYSPI